MSGLNNPFPRSPKLSPAKQVLFDRWLQGQPLAPSASDGIVPRRDHGPAPASFAQERLWFLDQLEPASSVYNLPASLRLVGTLDADALEQSLNALWRRHDALRTTFTAPDGRPTQVIAPPRPLAWARR